MFGHSSFNQTLNLYPISTIKKYSAPSMLRKGQFRTLICNRPAHANSSYNDVLLLSNGLLSMNRNQSSFAAIAGILMISRLKELWLALDVQERISRILKRIDLSFSGLGASNEAVKIVPCPGLFGMSHRTEMDIYTKNLYLPPQSSHTININ